jgi:hypothetical protein
MARRLERRTISKSIKITDQMTGKAFGELINVTTEGLMIISDNEIETGSIFQLVLHLDEPMEEETTIELGADCLWCRKVENFTRYWGGFQIIDASEKAISQLDILIEILGE